MKNDLAYNIIVILIKEGKIPNTALFEITEEHLKFYVEKYAELTNAGIWTKTVSNYRYARKLAGLTLVKFKLSRGIKANQCKEGFVYTLSNPAWPEHLKLGMSVDTKKRLAAYQTYSPFRDYKLHNYEFVFNRRDTEYVAKQKFNISIESGEWYKAVEADKVMKFMREYSLGA